MTDTRDRGLEFGDLADDLEAESYPLSRAELLERYGDREIEHAGGSATLREILPEEDAAQEDYENADEVHEVVLNMVGEHAVGRGGYSDRGVGNAEREGDEESF